MHCRSGCDDGRLVPSQGSDQRASAIISLVGVLIALLANAPLRMLNKPAFSGLISLDAYTWFFNLLILIATGLTVLTSVRYLTDDGLESLTSTSYCSSFRQRE